MFLQIVMDCCCSYIVAINRKQKKLSVMIGYIEMYFRSLWYQKNTGAVNLYQENKPKTGSGELLMFGRLKNSHFS
jgi:hypothetical protein